MKKSTISQIGSPMKKKQTRSNTISRWLTLVAIGASLGSACADEDSKLEALLANQKGQLSDQEYKDGMEQKKLSISDPDQALREEFWKPCAAVALGDGYSVMMQFRQAHPMVAEYHRRVLIFAGGERRGRLGGALQLRMNFGGRTHMLIYRHLDKDGKATHVTFEAREGGEQSLRLIDPDFEKPPEDSKREYIGLISGAAYPLKFVKPTIVSEETAREKMK